ncbi:MAG: hypothetical protein ACE5II_04705 [Anaerolineae bacterium]
MLKRPRTLIVIVDLLLVLTVGAADQRPVAQFKAGEIPVKFRW